jgi:hypothetical protein
MRKDELERWADARLAEICAATKTLPPKAPSRRRADPLKAFREDLMRQAREAARG